eukprot:85068-Rhodomonas_salina.2
MQPTPPTEERQRASRPGKGERGEYEGAESVFVGAAVGPLAPDDLQLPFHLLPTCPRAVKSAHIRAVKSMHLRAVKSVRSKV